MLSGRRRRFTDLASAQTFLDEHAGTPLRAMVEDRTLAADAASVHAALADKARRAQADEVFVLATGPTLAARIRSLELIAAIQAEAGAAR